MRDDTTLMCAPSSLWRCRHRHHRRRREIVNKNKLLIRIPKYVGVHRLLDVPNSAMIFIKRLIDWYKINKKKEQQIDFKNKIKIIWKFHQNFCKLFNMII